MTLWMSLVPVFGVAVTAMLYGLVQSFFQARCREATEEVKRLHQEKQRRARDCDTQFVGNLLANMDADQAIDTLVKARLAIHSIPSEQPGNWDAEDLRQWEISQFKERSAAILAKSRLISFCIAVAIFLGVVVAEAVLYSQMSSSLSAVTPQTPTKRSFPTP